MKRNNLFISQIELNVNVDVNHPFSFINLLLAFINRQISLPTTILNMRKYPSLKNCYTHLLKSAIQKLAGQVHHCKLQNTKKRKKKKEGKSPKTKQKPRNIHKTRKKKNFEKFSVLKNGPQKMRK